MARSSIAEMLSKANKHERRHESSVVEFITQKVLNDPAHTQIEGPVIRMSAKEQIVARAMNTKVEE